MKAKADRIKNLCETYDALLEREQQAFKELVSSFIESVKAIQVSAADRRFQRLTSQLKMLQERFDVLIEMGCKDFLAKIECEADEIAKNLSDSYAGKAILSLIQNATSSLDPFCESLLDRLIEATKAERGFILFYLPESTEADVIAARNFQTKNLSLEEYDFSRTLLREVFKRSEPLLVEDASRDSVYAKETSVIKLELKSVLAVPLKQNGRTVGALYLENNTRPCAFVEEDAQIANSLARFAVFYLYHARLLPAVFEPDSRIFLDASKASKEIIGGDQKIITLLGVISRIADSPATVLIEGETGTGKELVARALHYQSLRRDHPFVAINCAAIPESLLESELFGYEKGAFTGASQSYAGRIEQGSGGTLFLDEISELAYPLQAKLLRFLQGGEFNRLGGKETIKVDVRVVAATSKNLVSLAQEGKFQPALYYRLNVIPVSVPPLRERKEDIPLLIDHFLERFSAVYRRRARVGREVYECLKQYPFPGNVRELENLIHRLVALAEDDYVRIGDLPKNILQIIAQRIDLESDSMYQILCTVPADLDELRRQRKVINRVLAERERQLAERAVEEAGGNFTVAADRLGVHRTMLYKILKAK
jgi:Nif-specific regulatory protein